MVAVALLRLGLLRGEALAGNVANVAVHGREATVGGHHGLPVHAPQPEHLRRRPAAHRHRGRAHAHDALLLPLPPPLLGAAEQGDLPQDTSRARRPEQPLRLLVGRGRRTIRCGIGALGVGRGHVHSTVREEQHVVVAVALAHEHGAHAVVLGHQKGVHGPPEVVDHRRVDALLVLVVAAATQSFPPAAPAAHAAAHTAASVRVIGAGRRGGGGGATRRGGDFGGGDAPGESVAERLVLLLLLLLLEKEDNAVSPTAGGGTGTGVAAAAGRRPRSLLRLRRLLR